VSTLRHDQERNSVEADNYAQRQKNELLKFKKHHFNQIKVRKIPSNLKSERL